MRNSGIAGQSASDDLRILNEDELSYYHSIGDEQRKSEYLHSRVILWRLLSVCLKTSAKNISVVKNINGKPELTGHEQDIENLGISISYTDNYIAVAFGRVLNVGIDIEHIKQFSAATEIAQRFFHKSEVDDLARHQPSRHLRFAQFWTLKEAFLKYTGNGLSQPLNTVEFTLSAKKILFKCHNSHSEQQHQFAQYLLNNSVCLSVCTNPVGENKVKIVVDTFSFDGAEHPMLCRQLCTS